MCFCPVLLLTWPPWVQSRSDGDRVEVASVMGKQRPLNFRSEGKRAPVQPGGLDAWMRPTCAYINHFSGSELKPGGKKLQDAATQNRRSGGANILRATESVLWAEKSRNGAETTVR